MKRLIQCSCVAGALLALTTPTPVAYVDGRDYTDGSVVNVASIRTVLGSQTMQGAVLK
jgi:hypothetical protein